MKKAESNAGEETSSPGGTQRSLLRNLAKARRALNLTCWCLTWTQTGQRDKKVFHYTIEDGLAFIRDENQAEVKGSRKPLETWIEIGKQLRLAEAAIWQRMGQYPKPADESDPKKKVWFWYWFDGIRRVFLFDITVGRRKLDDEQVRKRFKLHRRLWVLAEKGSAIEQSCRQTENKIEKVVEQLRSNPDIPSEVVREVTDLTSQVFQEIGEQLGLYRVSASDFAEANRRPALRGSIAYGS